jgi:predicted PurR-regulated permease PerM
MEDFAPKYGKYAFSVLVALVLIGAIVIVSPFFPAILWAIVLSVLMKPLHKRLCKHFNAGVSAGITTLSTIAIVGIPLCLIGLLLGFQVAGYAKGIATPEEGWNYQTITQQIDHQLKPVLQNLGVHDFSLSHWISENKDSIAENIQKGSVSLVKNGVYTAFTLVIAFLTMFFLLKDGDKLYEPALQLIPLPRDKSKDILLRMESTIHAVFMGVVLVALIQGSIAGIAYWALGVPSPIVWMVATMVLCAVPLLGAPIVYIPFSIMLIANGKQMEGLALLAIGFIIISNVDNVLRPWIIGTRVPLHPMAIFFSLLGGVLSMGPVGIMAGPVLLTLVLAIIEVIRERLGNPHTAPLLGDDSTTSEVG